jgi:hypothetical protein
MGGSEEPSMVRFCLSFIALMLSVSSFAGDDANFDFRTKYVREYDPNNTSIIATKVDHPPKLDGTLNDPLWQRAGKTKSAFVLFPTKTPCDGRQTVTYFLYDDNALYIAFDCEEPENDQQQIDNPNILAADHVGAHLEIGDTRGRGPRVTIMGNRAGHTFGGKMEYKGAFGPKRWFAQMALPFASLPGSGKVPQRGEVWGVKLTRYGKITGTGASRLRCSWPLIPTISEDVISYNGSLFFDADNMLANPTLSGKGASIDGWQLVSGAGEAAESGLTSAKDLTVTQALTPRSNVNYALEWKSAKGWSGTVAIVADGTAVASKPLGESGGRIDARLPKDTKAAVVQLKLAGGGAGLSFHLSLVLDDIPEGWVCLTNNDWLPDRNLKVRVPNAAEGAYTYLKTPMSDVGYSFYRAGGRALDNVGKPTRDLLERAPARPDIGEEEYEHFPFETIYQDGSAPEFVGLPMGSFDKGGVQGWIPYSKGSLTGDESWAGWPVDRWAGASPHDILFDLKDKYYIRRIDIQQINSGFRNLEIQIRGTGDPKQPFTTIYRLNGPGTNDQGWQSTMGSGIGVYRSTSDLNSVAQQVRLSLGVTRPDYALDAAVSAPNLGRPNCTLGLFGVAEVWIWGEPKGEHADTDVKSFKVFIPNEKPPLECIQLKKLPDPVIWPRPKELVRAGERFDLKPDTTIICPSEGPLLQFAKQLKADIARRFCIDLSLRTESGSNPGPNTIWVGIRSMNPALDDQAKKENFSPPVDEPQGYGLKVSPQGIVILGIDAEGAFSGVQSLLQWLDHDENTAFARGVLIRDWPLLKMRTLTPSSDHRKDMFPYKQNEQNYFRVMDALGYYRFNATVNWNAVTPYQNETRTRELIEYANNRMIEVRPALYVRDVPGNCIELNPDDQPDGRGGIANSDGTWESANLCPSNPKTYKAIEEFLDKALSMDRNCHFVEMGYMGAIGGNWNVCRLCRKRGLSGFDLYANFINQINTICRARGKTPVFTNAIVMSDAIKGSSPGRAESDAFSTINRGLSLRFDRPAAVNDIMKSGFWTISKPWDTPGAISNTPGAYHWGGAEYFDPAQSRAMEGVIVAGEEPNYDWQWAGALSSSIMLVADAFWNGSLPAKGPVSQEDYQQLAANECVRFNERIRIGHDYPSWRTGMEPKFFQIDIKPLCNRSHVDDGSATGAGRSGPKEGLIGIGAAFDFRRVPTGKQVFASVPFEVIDPAQNNWKSTILVGDTVKEASIPNSLKSVEIPIGRKMASACVLHCLARTIFRAGQTDHYLHLILPAYVYEYSDGTRYVCDDETWRHWNYAMMQAFSIGGGCLGGDLYRYMAPTGRVALATNTVCGAGASLFLNEFVNPFPDKEIKKLIVQLPNPEQRDYTLEFHDMIFAVTGVEPTAWDVKFWSQHPKPLLQANDQIPDGAIKSEAGFKHIDNQYPHTYVCALPKPAALKALTFRMYMPGHGAGNMPVRMRHADCKIFASDDQKEWKPLGEIKGCAGMDGNHIIALNGEAAFVKVVVDPTAYNVEEEASCDIGLQAAELYVGK